MNKIPQFLLFLAFNFGCLWLSSYLMGEGPRSDWYLGLPRAPWTPPGWVFGVAWSVIMICWAIYMTLLPHKTLTDYLYYLTTLVLCASWNGVFFSQHGLMAGLINLLLLAVIVIGITLKNRHRQGKLTLLMIPFCLWVLLASSLNAYIVLGLL